MIIKRIILPLVIAVTALSSMAQDRPQSRDTEISVSYGALPCMSQIPYYHNHWEDSGRPGAQSISLSTTGLPMPSGSG